MAARCPSSDRELWCPSRSRPRSFERSLAGIVLDLGISEGRVEGLAEMPATTVPEHISTVAWLLRPGRNQDLAHDSLTAFMSPECFGFFFNALMLRAWGKEQGSVQQALF